MTVRPGGWPRRSLFAGLPALLLGACGLGDRGDALDGSEEDDATAAAVAPARFTIRPDDYHIPYAGTAADGRRFFLSSELFTMDSGYVGLFRWTADGSFDEVRIDPVGRSADVPPGQAAPGDGADELVQARLAELAPYVLEPITVAPFLTTIDGVDVGWRFRASDDWASLNIEPGDFICYYEPWDGEEYDT